MTSVHKMGAGLEQGSVYHLQGERVSPAVLTARSDLLNTTSPNSLIYAGLDGWRRQMVQHGHELLDHALRLASEVRSELGALPGLHVLGADDLATAHDPLKIIIDLHDLGRLRERVLKLQQHFGQASDDVGQILISADKISKRGGRIEALEFEGEGVVIPAPMGRKIDAAE